MAQVFSSKPVITSTPEHKIGDIVTWKGIGPMTVVEVKSDGSVRAYCLTMQIAVSSHDQLDKVQ